MLKGVPEKTLLSFLAEVSKTKACGRKVAFFLAENNHNKNRNGCKIGENFVNCGMDKRNLIVIGNYGKRADYKRADNRFKRAPGCKNNNCNSKPAVTAYAVMNPNAAGSVGGVHNDIKSAKAADSAADAGCEIFIKGYVNSGGVRGCGVFANRTEVKSGFGFVEEIGKNNRHGNCKIYKKAVVEKELSDERNVFKNGNSVVEGRFDNGSNGNIAARGGSHNFAEEVSETGSKGGKGKTGYVLVCAKGYGKKTVDKRAEHCTKESADNADYYGNKSVRFAAGCFFVIERSGKAGNAAHEHHTFNTKVKVTAFFG